MISGSVGILGDRNSSPQNVFFRTNLVTKTDANERKREIATLDVREWGPIHLLGLFTQC